MPVPSYRVPVRVARGTLAALTAGLADLQEGELCYATDENILYVIEGGVLTPTVADLTGIEIINDTTPQLGGNLDTNTFQIISTAAGNIQIAPDTTGVLEVMGNTGNDAAIQLNCEANTHGIKLKSPPHSAAASYTLVFPNDTGTSGQALTTDGSGVMSWTTPSTVGSIDDLTDVDTTTAAPTDGQALVWDNANSEWVPGNVAADLATTSIDALQDVDTTTAAPTNNQVLAWDGTNWVPADQSGGGGSPLDLEDLVNVKAGDTDYADVSLLLHGDGANGGSVITDSSSNSLTATTPAVTTSSTQSKFGGTSLSFPDSYLEYSDNSVFQLDSGDFTLETFIYLNDTSSLQPIYCQRLNFNTDVSVAFYWDNTSNQLNFSYSENGTATTLLSFPWAASASTWYHLALVRSGTGLLAFIDGVQVGTTQTLSGSLFNSSSPVIVGGLYSNGVSASYDGYMDEFRLTKGVARYTSGFSVPTSAFSDGVTTATDGQVLTWVDANNQWEPRDVPSGGGGGGSSTIIAPFAFGHLNSTTAGTGVGVSWGTYDAGTGNVSVTFDTAQSDTSYIVVTDCESADDVGASVGSKSTTGFTLSFYDFSGGNPASPSVHPQTFQVFTSGGTQQVAGGGGGGGGSSAARLTEAQTAASGVATFTGIGHSGTLVKITSSLDAWIVLYDSAASRTADSSRAYSTDPASGSGVLAEFYITAGTTVLATPGTTYFNNDTSVTEAVYAAVRDQAGADVNSEVTIVAYGNQTIASVSGGTFGSGV